MLPEDKLAIRYILSLICLIVTIAVTWFLFSDEVQAGLFMP